MSRGLGPLCSGPGESPYTLCMRLASIAGGGRYCSEHSYLAGGSGWTPPPAEITGAWINGHYHAGPSRAPKLGGVQPAPARFESEGTWFSEQARAERAWRAEPRWASGPQQQTWEKPKTSAEQKLTDAQAAMIKMADTFDTALATQRAGWQKDRAKLEEIRSAISGWDQFVKVYPVLGTVLRSILSVLDG